MAALLLLLHHELVSFGSGVEVRGCGPDHSSQLARLTLASVAPAVYLACSRPVRGQIRVILAPRGVKDGARDTAAGAVRAAAGRRRRRAAVASGPVAPRLPG